MKKVEIKLSELMGKRKIRSIYQLSRATKIRHEALTKLYNEDQNYSPSFETIKTLCDYFGCALGEFMNYDPNNGQAT